MAHEHKTFQTDTPMLPTPTAEKNRTFYFPMIICLLIITLNKVVLKSAHLYITTVIKGFNVGEVVTFGNF